jgi:lipopolysaccharide/colanic/teichoic acid biosynthesis glycosyltransferase
MSADSVDTRTHGGAWGLCKRAVDLFGAALGLVVLSPLFVMVAVAVRLDSRGPVWFRQERLGQDRRPFRVWKFRTMQAGASDEMHRDYIARLARGEDTGEGLKKLTGDPRVTRVGRLLRATSVDELPQLLNVLAGEMSLVGPRHALEYELTHYEPRHHERFRVKPGMTGLWQVSGRSELGFTEMLDLDVEYARTTGLLTDLRILLKTPAALLGRTA